MIIKIIFLLLSVCMNIDNWVNSSTLESYYRIVFDHIQQKSTSKSVLCDATILHKAAVCKNVFSLLRKNSEYKDLYVDYSAFTDYPNEIAFNCNQRYIFLERQLRIQPLLFCPSRSAIQLDDVNYKFGNTKIGIYPTRHPVRERMNKKITGSVESLMFGFLQLEEDVATSVCHMFHKRLNEISNIYELKFGFEDFIWESITALKPEELNVTVPKHKQNVTSESINYPIYQMRQIQENNILRSLNVEELMNLCTLILGRWKFEYEFSPDEDKFRYDFRNEETVKLVIPNEDESTITFLKGYGCFSTTNLSENSPIYKLVPGLEEHEVLLVKKLPDNYFQPMEFIADVTLDYIHYTMSGSELEGAKPLEKESS